MVVDDNAIDRLGVAQSLFKTSDLAIDILPPRDVEDSQIFYVVELLGSTSPLTLISFLSCQVILIIVDFLRS